jgi:hypothetical protein
MNRIKSTVRTAWAEIAVQSDTPPGRAGVSAAAGVVVAGLLGVFVLTFRRAALAAAAATPPRQSVTQVVVTGWVATFVVAGLVTYAAVTAAVAVRRLRASRVPAAGTAPDFS